MSPKTILLTGASRGIGLAIAKKLLRENHNVVLVARTSGPMEELKKQYPEQVEVVVGDLSDFKWLKQFLRMIFGLENGKDRNQNLAGLRSLVKSRQEKQVASPVLRGMSTVRIIGPQAVDKTVQRFSKLDSLIINHGTLSPVKRIADTSPEEWRALFDINFFSALAFITPSLPHLRTTHGTILLTSSGAAASAYSTWGAYGSSKASLNHLAQTLGVEEPLITTLSIRPGVVDTDMQKEVRGYSSDGTMDKKDAEKFMSLHEGGKLLKPELPGGVMAGLAVGELEKEWSGKFLR
ncbi:hypothetical protein ACMFMG_002002 [Clarireedia jacksonii]